MWTLLFPVTSLKIDEYMQPVESLNYLEFNLPSGRTTTILNLT